MKIARCARKNPRATRAILKKNPRATRAIQKNPARYARGRGLHQPCGTVQQWEALVIATDILFKNHVKQYL